jgi:hypothetical protein
LSRLALIVVLLSASASRADDTGTTTVVAIAAASVAGAIFDTAYTIYDARNLSHGQPGTGYAGLFEVLGAAPQVGIAAVLAVRPPPWGPARPLLIVWGLWATALTAHGIWSMASGHPHRDDMQLVVGPLGCAGTWRF